MLKQNLQQKLGLKINPLQIQLIKLLELPTYQLEQRIKEELESNPLLEEGEEKPEPELILRRTGMRWIMMRIRRKKIITNLGG